MAQKLYGVVYEQNSNRKIVPGVAVKAAKANAIVSGTDGHFTLLFPELKPGTPVQMNAQKTGWVVVNISDLDAVLPVESISYLHSITMRREAELKRENAELKEVLSKFMAKVEKRFDKLDQNTKPSQEQIGQQVQKVPEIAMAINSVNQDLVSDSERIAYRLVRQDSIEKAKQVREQLQSEKNFEPAQDAALAGDSRNLDIHRRNLLEQSRLALLEFDFSKADSTLAFLAMHDSLEFKSVNEYAGFLRQQMQYEKAIDFYKKAAAVAHTIFERIQVWNNMGIVYRLTNAYQPAEQILKQALDSSTLLADSNGTASEAYLALTQTNLGLLYRARDNYSAAEKAFKTALNIRLKQVVQNPEFFTPLLAAIYINLGALYNDNGNYTAAEKCYTQAMSIYEKLAAGTPNTYSPQLATLHNNLGLMQTEQKNFGSAKNHFEAALKILQQLAAANPLAYKADVAETLANQGDLYRKTEEYELAEPAYQTALQIRKELAEPGNSVNAVRGLANVQFRLSLLRMEEKDDKGAATFLQEAQRTQTQLAATNSVMLYGPLLADIEYTLGELYRQRKEDTAAERMYQHALDIRRQVADSLPGANNFQVAITYWSLGVLYEGKKNFSSAEANLQQAYEIYKRLSRDTLEPYATDAGHNAFLAASLLGNILFYQGRYDAAIRTQQDAINMAKQLALERPGMYEGNLADLQTNLGISYLKKNDYPAAQQAYWSAATLLQKLKNSKPAVYGNSFCRVVVYLGELPAASRTPAEQPIYQKMLAEALGLDQSLIDARLRERLKKL